MPGSDSPVQRYSFSTTPASWRWNLAAGYYELTLAPASPDDETFALSCTDFPLMPVRTRPTRAEITWPLVIPSPGTWQFALTHGGRASEPTAREISARRVPFPQLGLPWEAQPRGVRLVSTLRDGSALARFLADAAARGASFVYGARERLAEPDVNAALAAHGMLAVPDQEQVPFPVGCEGDVSGNDDAFSGWRSGGALSPLADDTSGDENDDVVRWSHHITTNGALTWKQAAWSDLAELWYHPQSSASPSPMQGFLLARVHGVGTVESEQVVHTGSVLFKGWQMQLPAFPEDGLLRLRWAPGQSAANAIVLRSRVQRLGTCIPATAFGELYCPWFPAPETSTPTVLSGRGSSPPDAIRFVSSRLGIHSLWKLSGGPGRRQWVHGVSPLAGYEQPSRTKDVLLGIRIGPYPEGTLLLVADLEATANAGVRCSAAPLDGHQDAANSAVSGSTISIEPGAHRLLIPLQQSTEGWSFLLSGPRQSVSLRSLEAVAIPLSVSTRADGPYWAESEATSRILTDGTMARQRWTVRMARGQPWLALTSQVESADSTMAAPPARLSFELPRHDETLVNGRPFPSEGSARRAVHLIVLRDSGRHCPDIAIIPTEIDVVWNLHRVGPKLMVEPSDGVPCSCIVAIGKLATWGGATTLRTSISRAIRTVTLSDPTPARLSNTVSKPVVALAEVESDRTEPYWVAERGWWKRAESQRYTSGDRHTVLVPVRIPGNSSVLLAQGTYLCESVRPSPGSQHSLCLSEPEREGVIVRVIGSPVFDVPLGVEFRHAFVSVTCNGRPWHFHDGRTVWLPASGTHHSLRVSAVGEVTPMIIASRLPIVSTRWTGARLTVQLTQPSSPETECELVVRYVHRLLAFVGVEGGAGIADGDSLIRVTPDAQIVHVRFLPRAALREPTRPRA